MTKRIWLAPSAFFPARGGVEELTLQLAREYQRRGHEVSVIVHRHPEGLPEHDEVEGVRVARVPFDLPGRRPALIAGYPISMGRQLGVLRRLGPAPDVIHVQCAANQVATLTTYATLRRVPLVITTQGEVTMDAAQVYQRSSQMRAVLRAGARRADALTACSRHAGDDAATVAPRFSGCEVVPNGVDVSQWTVTALPGSPVYAAWGRHVPQKGLDLLISAFALVRKTVPDAVLRIGGDGPESPHLREIAGPGVEFTGALDRKGVQRLLEGCRVAVVPSRLEPFGIVALEAMAAGRSVVWSTNGGLADATGGIGWGVDPTDVEALAGAMIEANARPVAPDQVRAHAETMSWRAIAERYLAIYDRVGRG
ncbi:putative glycosyl transferase [Flexivirga endophytica]|uniref:D-inositol 3-phosphate glycosyltransferase n=1 Tax=Flexivirga endophytica TaxID=1849103 RepID=A0A916TB36_9MICO|nr:glycosyltransferase family 4 protein [Flexivirga endophytica]GGB38123.1 putative glycosyl transferase [Flexivirga endophytica]GHB46076.1 putative glycosyl transferase [Flexivirga endophytica]